LRELMRLLCHCCISSQREHRLIMRQIKTYVMTIGVALSVTPIFNYALAQQGNSATQLMLQVQAMRQEVGELRDLIDRQQFQLKRLQRQVDAQAKQLELIQRVGLPVPQNNIPSDGDLSNYNGFPEAGSQTEPQPNADGSATNYSNQGVGAGYQANQQTASDVARANSANDSYRPTTGGQVVAQGSAPTVNQNDFNQDVYSGSVASPSTGQTDTTRQQTGSGVSLGSAYPPVVDRSFSTSTPDVPVTGAGTRQTPSPIQQTGNGQASVANQVAGAQGSARPQGQASPQGQATPQGQITSQGSAIIEGLPAARDAANGNAQNQQAVRPNNSGAIVSVPIQGGWTPPSAATIAGQSGQESQARASIDAGQTPSQVAPKPDTQAPVPNQATPTQAAQAQAQAPAVVSEEDYYAQGFELLKQSKYEEAASIFEQQLKTYPQGDLADDAHYWIAEAMHVSRKLDVAKVHLKAIINDYPQSRRVPDAMLKTAYIEQSQGNQIEARILFQEIVNMHPQSDAAIAAKNQLAAAN
jgi:tol-pal system protein YbgF